MLNNFYQYPGYQKTEIGWLPIEWIVVPIGKVITLSQYGLSVAADNEGSTPIIGMKNLVDGKVVLDNLARVSIETEEVEKFRLYPGDILLNRTNSYDLVGKVAIYKNTELVVFASYIVRFQFEQTKVFPEFINYFLNFHPAQQRLKRLATKGVSQANINPTLLRNQFLISLPLLEEQKKIVEILGNWDEAIAKTEKLITAKQKRKEFLLTYLLSQDTQHGWRKFKLAELSIKPISYGIVQTGEPIEQGIPCVRVIDLTARELNPHKMITTSKEISQSYKRTILEKGELMIALRGEIGLVRLVDEKLVGCNRPVRNINLGTKKW